MEVAIVVGSTLGYALFPTRRVLAMVVVALATLVHPMVAVAVVGCGVAAHRLIHIREARALREDSSNDGLLAIELVGLGVTSGLPFRNAASLTAEQIDGQVGKEITQALRSVSAGRQPSIDISEVRAMFSAAIASETTGMPLAATLNATALDLRRAAAAASRERLAKLPVKMLFPLAFLILPGFVLLTVVPPLMSGLSKLGL
jgi:Flp pilus assembly protein TadB